MNKNRLEAFSDGVLAIIITIMVLEIKVPHESTWEALFHKFPIFMSYIISFLVVGIYWGNHHHLLHAIKKVNSGILLSNLNLLFWLSLVPVGSGWLGETKFSVNATILYAILLFLCGISYNILKAQILKTLDADSLLSAAIKKQDKKGLISSIAAVLAIPAAFIHPILSGICFLSVTAHWLIPDKVLEKAFEENLHK